MPGSDSNNYFNQLCIGHILILLDSHNICFNILPAVKKNSDSIGLEIQ